MKLYTEEQVRKAINDASLYSYINGSFEFKNSEDDIINALTPIELPSDEEIEISNPYRLGGGNYNGSAAHKWQKGVEWMKYKIHNK